MEKEKKHFIFIAVLLLFVLYFFVAARPIPRETVLNARWLSSLETSFPISLSGTQVDVQSEDDAEPAAEAVAEAVADPTYAIPFTLGGRFGYVDTNGRFTINLEMKDNLSLSDTKWAQYGATPATLSIRNNVNENLETLEKPYGYPMFLDGRTFILGNEQNSLSETDGAGFVRWTYEFPVNLTCADAAAGLLLTGSVDGVIEVIDSNGKQVFSFAPGGSQYSIIVGCALSRDGQRIALIAGIRNQRFLILERFGNSGGEYKVIYHEFLGNGFLRPVNIAFIEKDRWIVFEREGGLGVYNLNSRKSYTIKLDDEIVAFDKWGGSDQLFLIIKSGAAGQKRLIGINLPETIFIQAPIKSDDVFLYRSDSLLFIGGGSILSSFDLEKN